MPSGAWSDAGWRCWRWRSGRAGWSITRVAVTSTLTPEDLSALRFGSAGLILLPVLWRRGLALIGSAGAASPSS